MFTTQIGFTEGKSINRSGQAVLDDLLEIEAAFQPPKPFPP
jgi:hypothetical protein